MYNMKRLLETKLDKRKEKKSNGIGETTVNKK